MPSDWPAPDPLIDEALLEIVERETPVELASVDEASVDDASVEVVSVEAVAEVDVPAVDPVADQGQ
ncbi:hypothetical protein [Cellulomonas soli]